MAKTDELTMIRATKQARRRIDRLAPRLEKLRGGAWSRPAVIDLALDLLEGQLEGGNLRPA